MDAKKYLSEILGYYKHKVDNDLCTMEEIESIKKTLEENLEVYGTIDELSKFYGVSEQNIRTTINRKMFGKPKRRVYYRFLEFLKVAPLKWHDKDIHKM